jgi:hypothetical protein
MTAVSGSAQPSDASAAPSVTPPADGAINLNNNDARQLPTGGRPDPDERTVMDQLKTLAMSDIDDDTLFALIKEALTELNLRTWLRIHPEAPAR